MNTTIKAFLGFAMLFLAACNVSTGQATNNASQLTTHDQRHNYVYNTQPHVLMVSFNNNVSSASVTSVLWRMRQGFQNPQTQAIVLQVTSGGGGFAPAIRFFYEVQEMEKAYDKQVYVYVADTAASGGYMMALVDDNIVVSPESVIGSIGVKIEGVNDYNKDSIIPPYAIGKYKNNGFGYLGKTDPKAVKIYVAERNKELARIYNVFTNLVKDNREKLRHLEIDPESGVFSGKAYNADEALKLGLVDEISSFDTFLRKVQAEIGVEHVVPWF